MSHSRWPMFLPLYAAYAALVLVSIGVLGMLVVSRVEKYELQQIEEALRIKAILVEATIRDVPAGREAILQDRVALLRKEVPTRITLLAADGRVLADSHEHPSRMENHANRPEVIEAASKGTGMSMRFSSTVHESMIYAARKTEGDSPAAFVRVARPLDSIRQELADLIRIVWMFAGGAAAAALVLAFWLAHRITRPLRELTAGAERIAAGNYGHKVWSGGRNPIGILARAFNTMSERLAAQFRQMEEDRQQLRAVLSGMVEGVVALDAEQRVLFANQRASQLLDFSTDAVVGRKIWEVVRQRSLQEVVRRTQESAEPYREELDWTGQTFKSLVVHGARLQGPAARGVVLVLQDTTELRRLERMRQEFVANVSHELKTPLSVIKACIETLLDGAVDDPENRVTFLEQIDEQSSRLHALILDLLSLARIESGAEVFEFKEVPLEPLVLECLERHRARADAKNQTLEAVVSGPWSVVSGEAAKADGKKNGPAESASALTTDHSPPTTGAVAWADEEAVSLILDNLVDNAVKYTPAGGKIRVHWRAEARQVCLEVEDNGIGIPERDLPRIFERFYRVDKARSRELGGTGLGLSIVKHLSQAMQGTVSATSRVNHGTTFLVRLPRAGTL